MSANRRLAVGLAAALVFAGWWNIVGQLFVPYLINSAYRGESFSVFNRMIEGQDVFPVSHYLSRWQEVYRWISVYALFLLPFATSASLLWRSPTFEDFLNRALMPSKRVVETELLATVGITRVRLVYGLVTVFLLFSMWDLITDREHWPFSQYAMYSYVQRDRSLTMLQLFGITAGEPKRIPLFEFQYIQPFDQSRLRGALAGMNAQPNRVQLLTDALRDCWARYEKLRLAGRHDGPPLQGMELDRLFWQLDPWARNVDRPERSETLLTVTQY